MPKYIDLLRSHQSPASRRDEPGPPAEDILQAEAAFTHDATGRFFAESGDGPPAHTSNADREAAWLNRFTDDALAIFKAAERREPANLDDISQQIRFLIQSVKQDGDVVNRLELYINVEAGRIRSVDDDLGGLVEKSVMMLLYTLKVGLQLRLNEDELLSLMLAGILHHIGMAQVPAGIRRKKGELSEDEREQIDLAPAKATAYLRESGISDERILSAVSQAGERHDGSGPQGLKDGEISRTARIIGLLSMFEALIHYRAYRKRLLPRDAVRELIMNHKSAFDPAMLKCLIDTISLYPVGTYIQLNSGDIGQVIRVHRRLPLRPVVRLSMDRHGNGIVPRDINLQTQPNLMVKRCMYREELAEISQQDKEAGACTQDNQKQ